MMHDWLKSEHEKVVRDSDRIMVLTRNLRYEIEEKPETGVSQGVVEHARKLEAKAQQLREAVEAAKKRSIELGK
jgi:hypothetical protein